MGKAQVGDRVTVHYTGRLTDGTEFDSSAGQEPLEVVLGAGRVIPGFENAIVGMQNGESRTVTIPVEEAYGPHSEELVLCVPRNRLPEDLSPEIGMQLQMQQADGDLVDVLITSVDEQNITLDANHPLAGQALVFDIQLVTIG